MHLKIPWDFVEMGPQSVNLHNGIYFERLKCQLKADLYPFSAQGLLKYHV